jgi:hypothetical protein
MQGTDKILGSKVNDLHGQIRKKRTFLTFFRKFCMMKVQTLKFFLQNIMLSIVTRRMRYVTHMCDVTCNVTEAKYGFFKGF